MEFVHCRLLPSTQDDEFRLDQTRIICSFVQNREKIPDVYTRGQFIYLPFSQGIEARKKHEKRAITNKVNLILSTEPYEIPH